MWAFHPKTDKCQGPTSAVVHLRQPRHGGPRHPLSQVGTVSVRNWSCRLSQLEGSNSSWGFRTRTMGNIVITLGNTWTLRHTRLSFVVLVRLREMPGLGASVRHELTPAPRTQAEPQKCLRRERLRVNTEPRHTLARPKSVTRFHHGEACDRLEP
jgi:hypothetical protein